MFGFILQKNDEFDNWLSREQQRFERLQLKTLRRLVKNYNDQPAKAIQFAENYLAIDDLAEDIQRQLITLYTANGNRSAAMHQFEQCVLVLERELGVPPLPETRAAYEAARDGRQLTPLKPPEPEWATLPGLDLPLIGREETWKKLEKAYGRFRGGGVIFISGEPGVGKSRLMQEFATAQDGFTLTGNNAAGSQTAPYAPLAQALRQALSLPARWRHCQPIWLAEAARLLPELAAHFPDLPAAVAVAPDEAQARLFEALTQLFCSLATDSPLLLCLDDVHWADEATLGWLQYVTKRLQGSQICLIATYRSQEAAPLGDWRRALGRANLMADVVLDGLTTAAVTRLLVQTGAEVAEPDRLAVRIRTATGGNAFFVLEIVRELLQTNQLANPPADLPLPATVREAVLRRAGRLSPLAQQILEITAVLSPLLTFPIINRVAGRGDMEVAASMEELITHQLLAPDADQVRFQHDLARETVYQNISAWRRRLLHRRAGEALTTLPGQETAGLAGAIAVHWETAGESQQAIDFYRQAAAAAQSLHAHQEAANHLRRAIKLATEGGGETTLLAQLHEALVDSLTIAGEFPAAEAAYRTALNLTPGDVPLLLAELERKLAATLPSQRREQEAETVYRAALARLDKTPPTAVAHRWQSTQLNILLGLLDALYFQLRPEAMAELNEQTRALLDAVGTAAQKSRFYSRLDQMNFLQNRYRVLPDNIALAETTLAYAQESGDIRLIARQQFHQGFDLLWHGDWDEADAPLLRALGTAQDLGDFWLQDQCLAYLTILYRLRDDTVQVEAQLPRLVEVAHSVGYPNYIGVAQANAAWLAYRAGEWRQAQAQAEAAVASWADGTYPFRWLAYWLLLALALAQNRLADAVDSARAMIDVNQQKLPDKMDDLLGTAVSAWDADDEVVTRDCLETAVALVTQHGYL